MWVLLNKSSSSQQISSDLLRGISKGCWKINRSRKQFICIVFNVTHWVQHSFLCKKISSEREKEMYLVLLYKRSKNIFIKKLLITLMIPLDGFFLFADNEVRNTIFWAKNKRWQIWPFFVLESGFVKGSWLRRTPFSSIIKCT